MTPLHLVIESALRSAAKCEEGRNPTWMTFARHLADDPTIAEAYSALAQHEFLKRRICELEDVLAGARQQLKRKGRDLLREEADEALPCFRSEWEPLSAVAQRTGKYSAQQLASRARDLRKRGLVEQRWNAGVMRISEWRRCDSDGTATAAANGDLPVHQDCQARPEGIAK